MKRMKRAAAVLLILAVFLTATACGGNGGVSAGTSSGANEPFVFCIGKTVLMPGAVFDPSALPEPDGTEEIPTDEGSDTQYFYGDVEITTHKENGVEKIYSIYFMKNTVATGEGVTVGDPLSKVQAAYGEPVSQLGTEYVYERDGVMLIFIIRDSIVQSVEYGVDDGAAPEE